MVTAVPATTIDSRMSRAELDRAANRVPESWLVRADGFVPKARYTSAEFADLELEYLWSRVWQVAGREEELRAPGDYVEYDDRRRVGRSSCGRRMARSERSTTRACTAAHGSPTGAGTFTDARSSCPYHGWRYALDGTSTRSSTREEFTNLPDGLTLRTVAVDCFGGFVFVNLDEEAEPLLDFLDPLPRLLAPYHLERMRLRSYRTTIIDANWKAVVDAFNEGYHVQGLHPQILPWTDDVSIEYEQFGTHAHYGRLPGARRTLRPSPRLGLGPRRL